MESFTAMSPEGVQAVKDAYRASGDLSYPMTFGGDWIEDYQTVRDIALSVVDDRMAAEFNKRLSHDGPLGERRLELYSQAEFDAFVDACVALDDSGHEQAADWLSGMAVTLEIEFI